LKERIPMHTNDYPSNTDRAEWGRAMLAHLATLTRFHPGDRDLHARPALVELGRDGLTYLFHALHEADVDIAAFAEACVEDWRTDLSDEAHEQETEANERTEVRSLLAGAVGSSLYPPSRTEWWWKALEEDYLVARFTAWPLGAKRRIVAALVEAEARHMNEGLRQASGERPAPTWDPEIALTAVPPEEDAAWPRHRLRGLFVQAHTATLQSYAAIERDAIAAALDDLSATASRKGWVLDLAALALLANTDDPQTPLGAPLPEHTSLAAPIDEPPAWREADGHWEVVRDLTEADAQILTSLANAIAGLEPDRFAAG
jgi:hypothetical protein